MYVHTQVCVHVHMHARMCIHVCTYIHKYVLCIMYVCMCIHIHVSTYVCVYYVCMHICMSVFVYLCMYACTFKPTMYILCTYVNCKKEYRVICSPQFDEIREIIARYDTLKTTRQVSNFHLYTYYM